MGNSYITTATTVQVKTGRVKSAVITVNAALTGTITVIDGTSGSTPNVAVITNPTVGSRYEYWGLKNGLRVITSATCDITVSYDTRHG
jgi:hypothetical protein